MFVLLGLSRTDTVKVFYPAFTGGGRPQVHLNTLLAVTCVEPLMFLKLDGYLLHMKESKDSNGIRADSIEGLVIRWQ